jgi:uncharacterized protein
MRRMQLRAPAPADLRVELIGVPEGAEIVVDLRLESVMEGVLASGTALAPLTGECGRCLDPVRDEIEVDLQELFAYADSTTSETTDDETPRVDGDLIDLEPVLRDALVTSLPMTPLCRPDCAGLCPVCGERLDPDDPAAGHDHPVVDPRWAGLARFADVGDNGPDDDRAEDATGAQAGETDSTGPAGA